MTWIKRRRVILFAVFLLAATVYTSIHAQTLPNYKVVWGINGIVDTPDGAFIMDVVPDGAAAKAGLSAGDIVLAVDGSPIKNSTDLKEKIKMSRPYTPVNVLFQRSGARLEKTLLPRGVLRLEVKDVDRGFIIPGVPQAAANRPLSALDALENINVLKEVIIDRKSGQIVVMGSYDPKYATGPIPYLDLLKTALKYPEPVLNLNPVYNTPPDPDNNPYGVDSMVPVLLGMPAAERERQLFIREMAAAYGITREEYAALYNYAHLDADGNLAPPEIGRIIIKACRHLGWDDVAAAYEQLAGNTADNFAKALKILGQETDAQNVLADKGRDKKQKEDRLLTLACIAIMEKLGLPPANARQLRYASVEVSPKQMFDQMYKFIPISINDKSGRPLAEASMVKVPIGDAPARIMWVGDNNPLLVHIDTEDLDRNSLLARILYEADYAGKTFLLRPDLFATVPGQITYSEYVSRKIQEMGGIQAGSIYVDARFWFEPKRVEMRVSPDKKVVSFGAAEIRFTTDMKGVQAEISKSEDFKKLITLYNDWCTQYTDNYELYAQIMPSFHSLRESAKVIALAKWLNSEKITVNLDSVKQERWDPPGEVTGCWRSGVLLYQEGASGKFSYRTYNAITGGVTFKPKTQWTAVESTTLSETGLSEQLKLSSQLGEKAVEAANGGDIENARYLSELSAQALTGEISRGDLIKLNVPLAEPVQLPVSPEAVLLQKEMIKQTYNEINELSRNPASKEKVAARLGQIDNIYNEMRNNPVSASDYLYKLQTGQLSTPVAPKPEPIPSQELLKNLYDTIHKRISGPNAEAQEIIRSLKTKEPPRLESLTKNINDLVVGDVILVAPVPFKDWEKAGVKDVLISNSVNLLDRWGSNNWSSPASHAAIFLGERNGKRWYLDNTSEHGPVIKEEQAFLKEYGQREMDVATLVGEPISAEEGRAIFKAAHELRDEGIKFGVAGSDRMVCSEASRWLLLKAGRQIPGTQSENAKMLGVATGLNKKDFVNYSPADFYDDEQYFVIRGLDIKRK